MRVWQAVVLAAGLMMGGVAWAASVTGLYAGRVAVADQSPAELQRAAREGLSQVVVRLCGRQSALESPVLKPELERADQWLTKFSYEQQPATAPSDAPQTWLVMAFDPEQVKGMLSRAGLPLWGESRPAVLVWVVQDGSPRQLASAQTLAGPYQALQEAAAQRGLPLLQPMADLEDETALPAETAWNFDAATIAAASARYRADAQLVARVKQEAEDRWSGEWLLLSRGAPVQQAAAGTPAEFMAAGVALAAEQLSARYTVVPEATPAANSGVSELEVSGISRLQDQQALMKQLARTSGLKDVFIHRVEGDRVWLRFGFAGSREQLIELLSLGGSLQPELAADGSQSTSALRYSWR